MNEIYLVIDSTFESSSEIIKGIFKDKREAKLFVADYVLNTPEVSSNFIELVKKEVTMPSPPIPYEK